MQEATDSDNEQASRDLVRLAAFLMTISFAELITYMATGEAAYYEN